MRIVCPSGSSSLLIPGPSKVTKPTKPGHHVQHNGPHKRETYKHRETKAREVAEAKRKNDKQKQMKQHVLSRYAHVYIGMLEATVTVEMLQKHFAGCGRIRRTTLRVSCGQAVNVGVAVPTAVRTTRDHKYASIEFYEPQSTLKALRLHGSLLEGTGIVVSTSVADLPEMADIVIPRMQKIRGELTQKTRYRFVSPPPSALVRHDTEVDFSDPTTDKIRLWGFSFAKCIM
ncbi:hypothetical protein BDN70DRAFT_427547 [Pholiota conissans]|uniref:RRM domain-containing protein n=1 Tax=Pholiota conissans TaxID=109636 RepID=A0A9P5Z7B6_9AGAR|nr:hypothetical protein BDN70DRAFT_427547 [Pholiota conissans]